MEEERQRHEKLRAMQIAVGCETFSFVCNLAGALLTNSLTVWANCLRVGLDLATSVFALFVITWVLRGKKVNFNYGLGKWENLSALINAVVMLVALAFLAYHAFHNIRHPHPITNTVPALLILLVFTGVNILLFGRFRRLHRTATSPVIHAQYVLYRNATAASFLSILAILGTWLTGDKVADYFDVAGAMILAGLIVYGGATLARQSLAALLDEAVEESLQIRIMRGLAASFQDYGQLQRIRSRRSGQQVFIELFLEFDAEMPTRELVEHSERIKRQVEEAVPSAEAWVVPVRPSGP